MAVDTSPYESRRRGVEDEYAAKKSALDFSRFTTTRRFDRTTSNYRRGFGREQAGFMAGGARRGLTGGGVKSGAFQASLQRRAGDHQRQLGEFAQDRYAANQGFDLDGANLDRYRQEALDKIAYDQSQEIALAALNIRALRPFLGS